MDEPETLEKKNISKAKSHNSTPPLKVKNEAAKRKSFNLNDAVQSLDLALGRLKKNKLVNEEYRATSGPVVRRGGCRVPSAEILMDTSRPSSNINPGIETASVMSLNFSHYELMRNLSCTNTTSEGTFSGATDGQMDSTMKHEQLEKFFRSAELWSRRHAHCGQSASVPYELAEE